MGWAEDLIAALPRALFLEKWVRGIRGDEAPRSLHRETQPKGPRLKPLLLMGRFPGPEEAAEKVLDLVKARQKHPSGAKALRFFSASIGPAKTVPLLRSCLAIEFFRKL